MSQSPPEPMSLHRKLTEVMAAVTWQPKTGKNTQQNYNFVTAEQIKDAVRGELAARRVMTYTSVKEVERTEWQTKSGTTMFSATIQGEVTFADGDSGELFTVEAAGEGMDSGDKALNKAMTAMVKYALINTFLIPTGDDPEADSPEVTARKPAQAPRTAQEAPKPVAAAPRQAVVPQSGSMEPVELSQNDWDGIVTTETAPLGLPANGNGHVTGIERLTSREFFDRTEAEGIDRKDVTAKAKQLFGASKWKVTELDDDQRATLYAELTA